jgi:alpha-tubulin suppressor-like RCC1 family protein
VVKVAVGRYHSLAMTEGGKVFSWGRSSNGETGHANGLPRSVPTRIPSLINIFVSDISAREDYSLVLSRTGEVYAFGANNVC